MSASPPALRIDPPAAAPRAARHVPAFYFGMALLCCAIAMVGFVPVYYWPVLRGTAFPLRLHLHAAVATLWVLLLLMQTGLIQADRRAFHMRLGLAGLLLAAAFVPLTGWAIAGMVTRSDPVGTLEVAVFFPQVASLLLFLTWVAAGILNRRKPDVHKRFMMMATIALLGTPIARIELWNINQHPLLMLALWDGPALLLVLHDLWTRRRVHRVTAICFATLLAMQVVAVALMSNASWAAIVARIAALLRSWADGIPF